jgi:hypothetical protein
MIENTDSEQIECLNSRVALLLRERDYLVKALQFIADGYDNYDVNHVDYRVKVYQVALDALGRVGGK